MQNNLQPVKNIIFDLGGVIIDLDQDNTVSELKKLTDMPVDAIYGKHANARLFNDLDKGIISEEAFFEELKKELRFQGPNEVVAKAWNAMLLGVPDKRLDLLVKMKQNYNTFLLSNTCEPHIRAFEHELYVRNGVKNFNDYFDKVYYSCRLGMRKPEKEIFEFVLKENELLPAETVFIDDSEEHVKAAGACGIRSYLLPKATELGDLLDEIGLI